MDRCYIILDICCLGCDKNPATLKRNINFGIYKNTDSVYNQKFLKKIIEVSRYYNKTNYANAENEQFCEDCWRKHNETNK